MTLSPTENSEIRIFRSERRLSGRRSPTTPAWRRRFSGDCGTRAEDLATGLKFRIRPQGSNRLPTADLHNGFPTIILARKFFCVTVNASVSRRTPLVPRPISNSGVKCVRATFSSEKTRSERVVCRQFAVGCLNGVRLCRRGSSS